MCAVEMIVAGQCACAGGRDDCCRTVRVRAVEIIVAGQCACACVVEMRLLPDSTRACVCSGVEVRIVG